MQALVIGPEFFAALEELDARARTSPIDFETMKLIMASQSTRSRKEIAGKNRALTIAVPVGYTVTLTYEEQPSKNLGTVLCRHVSVGLEAKPGHGPSPEAVAAILGALKFKNPLGKAPLWREGMEDGTFAVNILEPVSGDMRELEA